jgi:thiamine-phosphate pyrophosphorylase
MRESHTPGAERVLERAEALARARGAGAVEPVDLAVALAEEAESRAALILAEHGLGVDELIDRLGGSRGLPGDSLAGDGPLPRSSDLRDLLGEATMHAHEADRNQSVGTEHLLAGLLSAGGEVADVLVAAGMSLQAVIDRVRRTTAVDTSPLPIPDDLAAPRLSDPAEQEDIARILDASANRASEGLRVVEDYVRFVLDDPGLTRRLKEVRHRFGQAVGAFRAEQLITSRDTPGDVGTHIMTATEASRSDVRDVLVANLKRTAEALRSLEEYSKLADSWLAGRFEVLRYDIYTIEKRLMAAVAARAGLGGARLYVLVGGQPDLGTLTWVVSEAIEGGSQVIQLREKGLTDRELLTRAREVRILTAKAGVRFIMNDRPDLARLSGADGVHLGQDDVTIRDARRVVGPNALIGVSTHSIAQLETALRDGANYLGVGPVFESGTKSFGDFAGLEFVRRAAEATSIPWFAIGGIDERNLGEVLEAGATRVAVSGAVVRAERPRAAAAALRTALDESA